jgi:two-component system, NtrC family, sensor kinase
MPQSLLSRRYTFLRVGLGLLTIAISIGAYMGYQSLRSLMLDNLKQNALLQVETKTHEIDHWLGSLKTRVEMLANTETVSSVNWQIAEPYLRSEHDRLPDFSAIGMAEPSGWRYTTVSKPTDVSDRDWFKRGIAGITSVTDPVIARATGKPGVPISAPIPDRQNPNRAAKGVILGIINIEHIKTVTQQLAFGENSYNFLLNSKGEAIIHPKPEYLSTVDRPAPSLLQSPDPSLANLAKAMQAGKTKLIETQLDRQSVYVAFLPLKNAQWSMALVIPKASLEAPLRLLDGIAIVGLIMACGLIILLFYTQSTAKARAKQLTAEANQAILEQQITERTQNLNEALQQLQASQLQLVQSEKMSALGNLVAGVAHEINNPLGFLAGNLKPAQDYVKDIFRLLDVYQLEYQQPNQVIQTVVDEIDLDYIRQDLPQLIQSMQKGADRISSISKSLRTFSRADSESAVRFNLHEGIDSTLLILKHRLKANETHPEIQVIVDYGNLPEVTCYAGQLNQVFMNIIVNAIDALEEGVSHNSNSDKSLKIYITTETCGQEFVLVKIRDNGPGMPESVQQKIFEHLFTTKAVGKGTGLGLAISQQIITQKHHGTITVNSKIGEGTEFTITLPIQPVIVPNAAPDVTKANDRPISL